MPRLAVVARAAPDETGSLLTRQVHLENHPKEVPGRSPSQRPPEEVEPLTGELRRYHLTVSKRFLAKLAAARDALSHSHPGAGAEEVLEAALDLLLAKKGRQKGLVQAPCSAPPRPSDRARHIPAAVRRAVWLRDAGRCQWPMASGGTCGATRRLELDHIVPVARGGASTVENLRVTCHQHNQLAARQIFGEAWMERYAPGAPHARAAQAEATALLPRSD